MGKVQVPQTRWGGRWKIAMAELGEGSGEGEEREDGWVEMCDYGRTVGYQVARALNMGAALPDAGAGKRWEFGVDVGEGRSTLLVRRVDT